MPAQLNLAEACRALEAWVCAEQHYDGVAAGCHSRVGEIEFAQIQNEGVTATGRNDGMRDSERREGPDYRWKEEAPDNADDQGLYQQLQTKFYDLEQSDSMPGTWILRIWRSRRTGVS